MTFYICRVILSFNYNMLIPISKVDENMKRSQVRDAITTQKFFFRTNIDTSCDEGKSTSEPVVREMTLDQGRNSIHLKNITKNIRKIIRKPS